MLPPELLHQIVAFLETDDLYMLLCCNNEWFHFISNSNEFLYDKLSSHYFWKYITKPKLKKSIPIPRIILPTIHWIKTLQFITRKNLPISYIFELLNRFIAPNYFSEQEQQIWYILLQYNTFQISDGLYCNMKLIHEYSVECFKKVIQPFLSYGIDYVATDLTIISFILNSPFHSIVFDQTTKGSFYNILKHYIELNPSVSITDKFLFKLLFGFSMEQLSILPNHLLLFAWYNPPVPSRKTQLQLPLSWKCNRYISLSLKLHYSTVDKQLCANEGFLLRYSKHYPLPTHFIVPFLNQIETVEYLLRHHCKVSASVWEIIMHNFPQYTLECIGASLMDEFSSIHGKISISENLITETDLFELVKRLPKIHPPQFDLIPTSLLSLRVWKELVKKSAQLIRKCNRFLIQEYWKEFICCNQFVYYFLPNEMKRNETILNFMSEIATNVSVFDGTKFLTKQFWMNLLQKDLKGTFPSFYLTKWSMDYEFMKQVVTCCAVSDLIYKDDEEMVTLQIRKNAQLYLLLSNYTTAWSKKVCAAAMAKQISSCELPSNIVEQYLLTETRNNSASK